MFFFYHATPTISARLNQSYSWSQVIPITPSHQLKCSSWPSKKIQTRFSSVFQSRRDQELSGSFTGPRTAIWSMEPAQYSFSSALRKTLDRLNELGRWWWTSADQIARTRVRARSLSFSLSMLAEQSWKGYHERKCTCGTCLRLAMCLFISLLVLCRIQISRRVVSFLCMILPLSFKIKKVSKLI